jgi:hypothetical protein
MLCKIEQSLFPWKNDPLLREYLENKGPFDNGLISVIVYFIHLLTLFFMKSKFTFAMCAIMLPLFALLVGFKSFSHADADTVGPPPSDAVGSMVNGVPTLLMDKLVKTFAGGGEITNFSFVNFQDGLNLVRRGMQGGNYRTETFKVSIIGGWIIYHPVWFTVCSGDCSFCQANATKTSCNCAGGATCNFGLAGPIGVDVVVIA